jgi:hypothetical protein
MHGVLVHRADGVAVAGTDGVQPGIHEHQVRRRISRRVAVIGAHRVGPIGVDEGVEAGGDVGECLVP